MSTSIVIHRDNGTVGRLNLFDETDDTKPEQIRMIAEHWRSHFGPATKINIIETVDRKCRPNFVV